MILEINLQGLCLKYGIEFQQFLSDFNIEHVSELSIGDLEAICEEYELDLQTLLFKPLYKPHKLKASLEKIKFLLLDVDGVMTDGGMYVSENGDQMKKYNTKDGMGILHLREKGIEVGIISSGFTEKMVKERASLLGITYCYVGREPKINILNQWLEELKMDLNEVSMIGDDINDLPILEKIGLAVCPSNAVNRVKSKCHLILSKKGGDGCIREFIDEYLLDTPI